MARRIDSSWQRVARELKAMRLRAGMTQQQAAAMINVTPSYLSQWENGVRRLGVHHAAALDELYQASGALVRLLGELNSPEALPPWFREVPHLEESSSRIHEYEPMLVPGLFQTYDYARVVMEDERPWDSEVEIERLVQTRLKRQEVLDREVSPLIWSILDEAVLRRAVGSPRVMRDQLVGLVETSDRRRVRIQVIPSGTLRRPGRTGPFRIYTVRDRPPVASAEYIRGEHLMDKSEDVDRCITIFSALQAEALPTRQSVDLIKKVKDEYSAD